MIAYDFMEDWQINFLGNISSNKYKMTGAENILKSANPSGIYCLIKSHQLFFAQKLLSQQILYHLKTFQ